MAKTTNALMATGAWGENISWELYETSNLPPEELCTAVMCVAITDQKIVLACSKRGWGMLGGHIEDDELLEDTLRREAFEEGGFSIDQCKPFAVRKITAKAPATARPGKNYPFPTSYMVYYWATTNQALQTPTGEEILRSGSFALNEIGVLDTPDQPVIEAGWKTYNIYVNPRP